MLIFSFFNQQPNVNLILTLQPMKKAIILFITVVLLSSCALFKKGKDCNCPDQQGSKAKKTSRKYK
jgi:hypothetical protein